MEHLIVGLAAAVLTGAVVLMAAGITRVHQAIAAEHGQVAAAVAAVSVAAVAVALVGFLGWAL